MPQSDIHRFWLVTLGCKVNQYEARALAEAFAAAGYAPAATAAEADLIVLLSCAVTARAEAESRRLTRTLVRQARPGARVVVTGCAAAVSPRAFAGLTAVPVPDKGLLARSPAQAASAALRPAGLFPALAVTDYDRARALLKIQDGCSHGCSYCIVPSARGASISRPYPDIVDEARRLLTAGHQELGLTGINLGHFGPDLSPPLTFWQLVAALEKDLAASHGNCFRLRLGSLDPAMLTQEGVEVLTESRHVCPHLHISLQSADPGILTAMRRRPGDAAAVSSFVDKIRVKWKYLALGLDMLTGFPGESDAAYAATAAFLAVLPITYAHVFPYSRRPGTPAAAMAGQVAKEVKIERAQALRALATAKSAAFLETLAGQAQLTVALERSAPAAGTCEAYVDCRFAVAPDAPLGSLVAARPVGIDGDCLTVVPLAGAVA
ncbi:MiaB/RimO family radical SAM methylthiotransferase [Desulfovibrio sp. TomC]|uniref:MiaB/RimO family radical SAM methylthiotransferase n=1 Tax=Desulfovibrio sp. TomC TaxID=1562888 RepID=UPI000573BB54|nr:MiaB/RimO family radical SAM methylthiotransferase [Desulfovibrio sp. TomC]KHK03513.1 tRNA-t(6)A37 methylthiotransferase [Desulfovibrio sp. TomC]